MLMKVLDFRVMLNIFAERFVSEDDKAEYKYLQSPITMKEMLTKDSEYRFEYQRRCKNGEYRYHEVKIKRDESNLENLCAIMGVKDIEISGLCTKCDQERFYSHRGMGEKRGVMAGIMELI